MEVVNIILCVTMKHPLTYDVIEEEFFNNTIDAKACFNEMCDARPKAIVEFGIMTLYRNPEHDSYKVINTRW